MIEEIKRNLLETCLSAGLCGNENPDLATIIGTLIGTALSLVGIIFFVLIVYAGFVWMTSLGNEEKVLKAKRTIRSSIIGLIIVISSYAITTFIFSAISG